MVKCFHFILSQSNVLLCAARFHVIFRGDFSFTFFESVLTVMKTALPISLVVWRQKTDMNFRRFLKVVEIFFSLERHDLILG